MEKYEGVKFKFRKINHEIPQEAVKRFLGVDKMLARFLNPQQNEGNMSMRLGHGFLIKGAGARMSALGMEDISYVIETKDEIEFNGARPSSESRMHAEIYINAPWASFVLHFHDDGVLPGYDGPVIGPYEYGTAELAHSAGRMAGKENEFMIKDHGFVIITRSEKELIERLRSWKKS